MSLFSWMGKVLGDGIYVTENYFERKLTDKKLEKQEKWEILQCCSGKCNGCNLWYIWFYNEQAKLYGRWSLHQGWEGPFPAEDTREKFLAKWNEEQFNLEIIPFKGKEWNNLGYTLQPKKDEGNV